MKKTLLDFILSNTSNRRQIKAFGILMAINYPFFALIWNFLEPHSISNIPLRCIAFLICLPLIFYPNSKKPLNAAHATYWNSISCDSVEGEFTEFTLVFPAA